MPQVHLGLYEVDGPDVLEAVPWALKTGYRGVDSAQWYYNEAEAGQAIRGFLNGPENTEKLSREDIFYTSKLQDNSTSYEIVRDSIVDSVKECGLDYIDLFLLHSPLGGREARLTSWRAVEDAIEKGIVRSGGISNFGVLHVSFEMLFLVPRFEVIHTIQPCDTLHGVRNIKYTSSELISDDRYKNLWPQTRAFCLSLIRLKSILSILRRTSALYALSTAS